jgi:hypothetical protein
MAMVVTYPPGGARAADHEAVTRSAIARALAEIQGFEFGGAYDPGARYDAPLYFVPRDTLVGADEAHALGVGREEDLFGGVVPFAFVATKTIAHPLVRPDAAAPAGWNARFPERVREVVLPGFTAFAHEDAQRAGSTLLKHGPIRIKPGRGIGGRGQTVIQNASDLEHELGGLQEDLVKRDGLVIEPNLADVMTYSVGQVRVAGIVASYFGTQRMTRDTRGAAAYGGSDLLVVRGGFDVLGALPLAPEVRAAIGQARAFDAATAEFAGMFASRRNYDAVRGRDGRGRWRCGVLEQSWRIGGASGPEVAALAAFRADPALPALHARSTEIYGDGAPVPGGAIVHYRGIDERLGPLTKYTVVEPHAG